ncbi:MAG: UDP-N-acetylmuramoyl-L-alanine--D-glutamate ligase, partial [Betaproteobacteria bacterium]|nr:UDP-N-acetylmuramoyl-L-alanine--D-glutamate ligase [Betaproteobacteria bacterium]
MTTPEQHLPPDPLQTPDPDAGVVQHAPVEQEVAPLSLPAAPASTGPKALPTTLTAAKEAAEFVARIFAETEAEKTEGAEARATEAEVTVDETVEEAAPAVEQVFAPLAGQNVLILGLGASGLAMARWCV